MADPASRKWRLTFDNPAEHGWTHEEIPSRLANGIFHNIYDDRQSRRFSEHNRNRTVR